MYDPQTLNAYMFERGNPYANIDEDGHELVTVTLFAALSALLGYQVTQVVLNSGIVLTADNWDNYKSENDDNYENSVLNVDVQENSLATQGIDPDKKKKNDEQHYKELQEKKKQMDDALRKDRKIKKTVQSKTKWDNKMDKSQQPHVHSKNGKWAVNSDGSMRHGKINDLTKYERNFIESTWDVKLWERI